MAPNKADHRASVCYVRLSCALRDKILALAETEDRPLSTTIRRLAEHALLSYDLKHPQEDRATNEVDIVASQSPEKQW